ncbi:MAG: DUF3365 domain-containing protein [Nitrospiraceae bacterium]|nr:DUF3365 domain-containing protein [Nitrospiraceae bacterium]
MKRFAARVVPVFVCMLMLSSGIGFAADAARQQQAAMTAKGFIRQLAQALKKEMAAGGPVRAVDVCSRLAPRIAGRLSRETGWKVTRVGTRVRNPLLGMPDAWEQKVLKMFESRAAKGEPIDQMSYSEVVTEPDGQFFRYMKAIAIKPPCLACHGSESQISPEVRAIIEKRYPHDKATGYKLGELRGAISIKEPIR